MKWLVTVILIIVGALYYLLVYPPVVLKGRTEAALQKFAASVALKNRDSISEALYQLLDDDAKITLEVSFFSIGTGGAKMPVTQEMDKTEFILFIDNVLYPLSDYNYTPSLEGFVLADDERTAEVTFSSNQWAEGASFMGGVSLGMRYDSTADCEGMVVFRDVKVLLKRADCKIILRPTTTQSPSEVMKKISR